MSEVAINEEKKQVTQNKSDLLKIMQDDFASSVNTVYINSTGKEAQFKEITVQQQKSLTRIISTNENRKDIVYDAQCALINTAAITDGFNIYDLTEFDRLKLMIALYQANMFQNKAKFVCEECGEENTYTIDFNNVLIRLNSFNLEKQKFEYENKNFKYEFIIRYPSVKLVKKFHESYCKIHNKRVPNRERKTDESIQNLEYINLFIEKISYTNKQTGKTTVIDFNDYLVSDIEDIMCIFPQDVLYSDNGVIKFIVTNMIQPINDAFDKHECWKCGTIHEKGNINQTESFF